VGNAVYVRENVVENGTGSLPDRSERTLDGGRNLPDSVFGGRESVGNAESFGNGLPQTEPRTAGFSDGNGVAENNGFGVRKPSNEGFRADTGAEIQSANTSNRLDNGGLFGRGKSGISDNSPKATAENSVAFSVAENAELIELTDEQQLENLSAQIELLQKQANELKSKISSTKSDTNITENAPKSDEEIISEFAKKHGFDKLEMFLEITENDREYVLRTFKNGKKVLNDWYVGNAVGIEKALAEFEKTSAFTEFQTGYNRITFIRDKIDELKEKHGVQNVSYMARQDDDYPDVSLIISHPNADRVLGQADRFCQIKISLDFGKEAEQYAKYAEQIDTIFSNFTPEIVAQKLEYLAITAEKNGLNGLMVRANIDLDDDFNNDYKVEEVVRRFDGTISERRNSTAEYYPDRFGSPMSFFSDGKEYHVFKSETTAVDFSFGELKAAVETPLTKFAEWKNTENQTANSPEKEPIYRIYQAELDDPDYPDRFEIFSAENDTEALKYAIEDYCFEDVSLLELFEMNEDYERIREVQIPQPENMHEIIMDTLAE
jgi:hypothetical protein